MFYSIKYLCTFQNYQVCKADPTVSQGAACLYPCSAGVASLGHRARFRTYNLGLRVCKTSPLPTEPFPQPFSKKFSSKKELMAEFDAVLRFSQTPTFKHFKQRKCCTINILVIGLK